MLEFQKFNKIPRLSRDMIITEKLDGTNAQIFIYNKNEDIMFPDTPVEKIVTQDFIDEFSLFEKDEVYVFAGSRKRWLDCSSEGDNYGFAKWVKSNAEELLKLGEGKHYGEWYGKGIQRGYGLDEKRFVLFNVGRWANRNIPLEVEDKRNYCPECCSVVPVLYEGMFDITSIDITIDELKANGSKAVPDFMNPEGIIVRHQASGQMFKKTIENDEKPKGQE